MSSAISIRNLIFSSISVITLVLTIGLDNVCGHRILALTLMVTPSHKIPMDPLFEELARRGHEVTVVSPIRAKHRAQPNLREILTFELDTVLKIPNVFEMKERGEKVDPIAMLLSYSKVCMEGLKSPALQALKTEKFDLVIIPIVFNECAGVFARKFFDAPVVVFSPVSALTFVTSLYGNPSPPSFVPFLFTGYGQRMTFWQRVKNVVNEGVVRFVLHYKAYPALEHEYREILNDPTLLSVVDMYKETSLILSNSHMSISQKRPFLPNIIEVGGLHCHPAQPLPLDLESFVQGGSAGFIIFSMGSALRASDISADRTEGLLRAFAKLKQRIVWKWDGEAIPNLPPNVMLKKWLPQQDLLGHPNIRLFVTHGGFGSTTEAVYHAVPLVGIPMFSDQENNMKEMEQVGIGITLDFLELGEVSFLEGVSKVLQNDSYRSNVQRMSKIFRDQPNKPLARAVYWTEYVIRHKGAPHLISAGRDLNFFQYHSLDVVGSLAIGFLTVLAVILWLIKFTCKKLVDVVKQVCDSKPINKKE